MLNNQENPERVRAIRMAWRNWLMRFVPLMSVYLGVTHWFGFRATLPLIIGVLILTLLYQRYVKKRTWRSIMWGVYASDE